MDKARPVVFREGTLPSGHRYTYFPDGSGGVHTDDDILSAWHFSCKVDRMTDRRNCSLSDHGAWVLVYFGASENPQNVCIVGHDFPGRTGMIRVDGEPPVTTNTDGCVAGSYLSAMLRGQLVTARRVEWPYDYSMDRSGSLEGLDEAFALMRYVRANVAGIAF